MERDALLSRLQPASPRQDGRRRVVLLLRAIVNDENGCAAPTTRAQDVERSETD